MGRIIAIANQKGGVGKTTTAINLSSALAKMRKTVLLVDFDPQGNAGRGLGFDVTTISNTIYDVILERIEFQKAIKPTDNPNLFLLPSNLRLASLDVKMQEKGEKQPFSILRKFLALHEKEYDFIIIDCPPSLGLLNINALVAAHEVIIPVQCEYFAMEAIAAILSSISKIQKDYNHDLHITGFLLTMYDSRTVLGTEVATQVRGLFKESTFLTTIPRNVSIPEASARGMAVTSFRPTAQGSLAYISLAKEVLDRG